MRPSEDTLAAARDRLAAGDHLEAIEACFDELVSAPTDIPLLAMLTAACESAGEVQKARKAAARWVEISPRDPYAHYKLAMIDQRLQNYQAAVARLKVAVGVGDPDDDISLAAWEALRALDGLQTQQVIALRDCDLCFRLKLRVDPDAALEERGFSLSPAAVRRITAADDGVSSIRRGFPWRAC